MKNAILLACFALFGCAPKEAPHTLGNSVVPIGAIAPRQICDGDSGQCAAVGPNGIAVSALVRAGVLADWRSGARTRLDELAASASLLGAARVVHLGYADSGHGPILLPDPPDRLGSPARTWMRRPDGWGR